MERILVQSGRITSDFLSDCSTERKVQFLGNRRDLCYKIVNDEDIYGVVVEMDKIDEENKEFIVSLHRHFPLLSIGAVSPVEVTGENVKWIDRGESDEELSKRLCSFVNESLDRNRREHHRFDWILNAYLDGEQKEDSKYRVRSLSAGGAFLESSQRFPEPGTVTTIRITFQNFQMFAECEILDRRNASSNLPFGFGIRFINIQQKTRDMINRMVNDAVFQILIEPELEPEVPALFEEELTPDFMAL